MYVCIHFAKISLMHWDTTVQTDIEMGTANNFIKLILMYKEIIKVYNGLSAVFFGKRNSEVYSLSVVGVTIPL